MNKVDLGIEEAIESQQAFQSLWISRIVIAGVDNVLVRCERHIVGDEQYRARGALGGTGRYAAKGLFQEAALSGGAHNDQIDLLRCLGDFICRETYQRILLDAAWQGFIFGNQICYEGTKHLLAALHQLHNGGDEISFPRRFGQKNVNDLDDLRLQNDRQLHGIPKSILCGI